MSRAQLLSDSKSVDIGRRLLERAGIQNPHPVYRELREKSPLYWSDALGGWLVTAFSEVRETYRDHTRFSSARGSERLAGLPPDVLEKIPNVEKTMTLPSIGNADPPIHGERRALVNRPLAPRRVAAKREWVESCCARFADALASVGRVDLIESYTSPVAYGVILDLFGSPEDHREIYDRATRAFFAFANYGGADPAAALAYEQTLVELRSALEALYPSLRARNADTIIGSLLEPEEGEARVSDDELFILLREFFSAGQDNLIYTVAVAIMELLRHPEQLQLVRDEPALAAEAFEEAIRWEPTNQANTRRALVETTLGDQVVRPGETLFAIKAAANRDPAAWTNPEVFDITRDTNEPGASGVSFGQGIHFCVGAGLARLVGPIAINTLLDRFPQLRLEDGWSPRWVDQPLRRKLTELPVVLS